MALSSCFIISNNVSSFFHSVMWNVLILRPCWIEIIEQKFWRPSSSFRGSYENTQSSSAVSLSFLHHNNNHAGRIELNHSVDNQNYSGHNLQFDLIQKAPLFTCTFMHLADAFIQRDLQCIHAIHLSTSTCFLGIEPTTFVLLTHRSTTEPQLNYVKKVVIFIEKSW